MALQQSPSFPDVVVPFLGSLREPGSASGRGRKASLVREAVWGFPKKVVAVLEILTNQKGFSEYSVLVYRHP